MTFRTLVLSSLRFHWRSLLGVLVGAALGTAILVGALAVGDSVRYSLREMALARLGNVHLALQGQSRFFRQELARDLAEELKAPVAPAVVVRGTASAEGGEARAGRVQIVGAGEEFWKLGNAPPLLRPGEMAVVLNERLAKRLGAQVGQEVVLRADKPSLLSRDAPLSTVDETSVALRLPVARIASDAEFGRFSLEANQLPPYNAFVPLTLLQERLALPGRVNTLLVGATESGAAPADANAALWRRWRLADASLELRSLDAGGGLELRTDRVFLDAPVGQAATRAVPGARGVLTYFVNELRSGSHATPYSAVAALDGAVVPPEMADDEILINEWLAEDLGAAAGDEVTLRYYVVGPLRQLTEQSRTFRVRGIVPIRGEAADPKLMPDFPGVADAENCRDWRPGIPIDLDRIRDEDEEYWDRYRGTPKAFVTLRAGQEMWNNRFGNLTAVRYPGSARSAGDVEARLTQALNPASIGLFFLPVRLQALAATSQALDFGQLFLGFSFFLIAAALLLTALLFGLNAEQRSGEVGLLLAVGIPARRVRSLLLAEGAALALAAGLIGAGAGLLYTHAVIHGLSTVWSGAVAESALRFHASPATVAGGALAGFLVSLAAIWLVARKQARAPARELLASGAEPARASAGPSGRLPGAVTVVVAFVLSLVLVGAALTGDHTSAAGTFFGAGALLLIAAIAACRALLVRIERAAGDRGLTIGSLGTRNSARRWGRSLSAVALLACGSFLVVAVGANRHDPHEGAHLRSSGTGGFALYGEATLPVYQDLNAEAGRDAFGLDPEELEGAEIVPLRLREGDEASCLNLNRVQAPRILGVRPEELRRRGSFTFANLVDKAASDDPWALLERPSPDGTIPAIGDVNTVVWSLGKSAGEVVSMTDDRGRPVELRIVGVLSSSILQGGLIVSEQHFIERFPAQSGYQVFLVDAPPDRAAEVNQALTRAMEDVGMALTPAPERLAEFATVENTYLSIFAVLGGLGLILGSVGLGVVVLRNVLERRGELALLRAVGFRGRMLQWLVFSEHSLLLALGLAAGVLSALLAVLPALRSPGAEVPYASLAVTLLAVLASGFLWTWGATALALRDPLLNALRNE
jgi:ABC-type antimicrobial peptide transport system permease subunit